MARFSTILLDPNKIMFILPVFIVNKFPCTSFLASQRILLFCILPF